jgi:hypothetical protein
MPSWEYASVAKSAEAVSIRYGSDQDQGVVSRWQERMERLVVETTSDPACIVFEKDASAITILGWLGRDGWEAIGLSTTRAPVSTEYLLKRSIPPAE